MILLEALQANAKRVVEEWSSMVRRRACWAPEVILIEPLEKGERFCQCQEGKRETAGGVKGSAPVCFVKDNELVAARR